ncbi:MAG: hypothetical protein FWE67_07240 [Planctomycetaceae bacterium]|nr:hypothetical protein [Planctomycetaceae bacterium]
MSNLIALLNRKVISIPEHNIIIYGNWVHKYKGQKNWEGQALSEEPMVAISFLECDNQIEWGRSERNSNKGLGIEINIHKCDNTGLDVRFVHTFNHGYSHHRSEIENENYFPSIFTGNTTAGKISLFCDFEGNPKLKLYCLFIPSKITKIVRNGIWHIKREYLHLIDDGFIDIFQYGRKGIISKYEK